MGEAMGVGGVFIGSSTFDKSSLALNPAERERLRETENDIVKKKQKDWSFWIDERSSRYKMLLTYLNEKVTSEQLQGYLKTKHKHLYRVAVQVDPQTKQSRRYAFVEYLAGSTHKLDHFKQALKDVNGDVFLGNPLSGVGVRAYTCHADHVTLLQSMARELGGTGQQTVEIKKITKNMTDESVHKAFSFYGEVVAVKLHKGEQVGKGSVTFSDYLGAVAAICQKKIVMGNDVLDVSWSHGSKRGPEASKQPAAAAPKASAGKTAAQKQRPLPPGWATGYDEASGVPYYYHTAMGLTQWEFPTAGAAARQMQPPPGTSVPPVTGKREAEGEPKGEADAKKAKGPGLVLVQYSDDEESEEDEDDDEDEDEEEEEEGQT